MTPAWRTWGSDRVSNVQVIRGQSAMDRSWQPRMTRGGRCENSQGYGMQGVTVKKNWCVSAKEGLENEKRWKIWKLSGYGTQEGVQKNVCASLGRSCGDFYQVI
eukprot:2163878-Pyramimonas_sp.AAC.1